MESTRPNFTVGTLRFGGFTTASNDWQLVLPAGNTTNTLTLDVATGAPTVEVTNQNATVAATLAGTKGLTKIGAGALFLTGANTSIGTTTISTGPLVMGNGGTTGSLQTTQVVNSIGVAGNGLPVGVRAPAFLAESKKLCPEGTQVCLGTYSRMSLDIPEYVQNIVR